MRRRTLLAGVAMGLGLVAGCTGDSSQGAGGDPTPTPSQTPTETDEGPADQPSNGSPTPSSGTPTPVDPLANWPKGPKDPPERPATVNESSVREFVHTLEYRYVYNTMWYDESTEVQASCDILNTSPLESGYEITVSCTAYSNTGGEPRENGTGTTTQIHSDYFTQTYVYVVTEDSITRRREDAD